MRVGLLTGGGDAPGLNGIIESSVRVLRGRGCEVIGIQDGFEGVFQNRVVQLDTPQVLKAHSWAGTLLGTSNKSRIDGREAEFRQKFAALKLDGLIACGGDGTFAALSHVVEGLPLIGVPKTIDNDLTGTDVTFGFDTACTVVAEAVDALRFTAEAHQRIIVVETMGRTAGWIALGGGLASYAEAILLPERPFDRAALIAHIKKIRAKGQRGTIIVVSEGAMAAGESATVAFREEHSPQAERYGGIAFELSRWIEREVGVESRHVVLGHLQRARQPTTTDRFLTLSMGVEAAKMALDGAWGQAAVYRRGVVTRAPIADLMGPARLVDSKHPWVQRALDLGLFI